MITSYKLQVKATCPNDTSVVDEYEVTILVDGMITAETILETVEALTAVPIYQEHLTLRLRQELQALSVHSEGTHIGVDTSCTCS